MFFIKTSSMFSRHLRDTHTDGDDPIAVGNRIGAAVIAQYANDGANEANQYADTTDWEATNPVMVVDEIGLAPTERQDCGGSRSDRN